VSPPDAGQRTLVTFLLDHSAPMAEIRDTTIKSFNSYLDILKAAGDRIEFTLMLFNSEGLDQVHVCKPINSVPHLYRATYAPRAKTPLIDATYQTISAVTENLQRRADTPKVVICIQSGGLENCSAEHTWDGLRTLIEDKTATGWQFHFLGAGIDSSDQGDRMGIDPWQILRYDYPSPEKTELAFRLAASSTVAFANSESKQAIFGAQQVRDIGVLLPPVILP
jgi:hypothetical protein